MWITLSGGIFVEDFTDYVMLYITPLLLMAGPTTNGLTLAIYTISMHMPKSISCARNGKTMVSDIHPF